VRQLIAANLPKNSARRERFPAVDRNRDLSSAFAVACYGSVVDVCKKLQSSNQSVFIIEVWQ
jgi:hypothetical protein